MMAHIDWLTIVGRRPPEPTDWTVHSAYLTAVEYLEARSATFREAFGSALDWQIVKPRAPYSFARRADDNSMSLYVHPLSAHFTFEASGTACQRAGAKIHTIMRDFADCLSRVDIAVDMETDVTPMAFDKACNPARINTRSRMSSQTGETIYIGSRSSERFCRVYRYNPPHPRSHLLRAEFQLKGDFAKQMGEMIGDGMALNGIAAGLGYHFGFQHPVWRPDAEPQALKVQTHAQSGNTVYWLTTTVAPLLRRLQRENKLDLEAWLDEYVRQDKR